MLIVRHPPEAELPYTFDWAAWLESGEVIQLVEWVVGAGLQDTGHTNDDTKATINLRATGAVGDKVEIVCIVTSNASQTKKDSRRLFIKIDKV